MTMNAGQAQSREPKRFSAADALDKTGRRVCLREAFAGIPAGTIGVTHL